MPSAALLMGYSTTSQPASFLVLLSGLGVISTQQKGSEIASGTSKELGSANSDGEVSA